MREEGADTRSGGTGLWMAGIVIAVVIAAGAYMTLNPETGPSDEDLAAVVAPAASVPSTEGPAGDAVQEPERQEGVSEPAAEEAELVVEPQIVPSIDEVRLEGDGLTVVAGRAAPGAQVSVKVDGEEVATAVADDQGAFATVGLVSPSDAARVLTLEATDADETISSAEDVILAPVPVQTADAAPSATEVDQAQDLGARASDTPPETAAASNAPASETLGGAPENVAVAEAGPADPGPLVGDALVAPRQDDIAALEPTGSAPKPGAPAVPSQAEGNAPTQDATPQTPPASEPQVQDAAPVQDVAILKSTAEGVTLLQSDPQVVTSVAIDTIGYSDAGDVQLSGRAAAGTSEVRVYLNNRFATALPVERRGAWRGTIPQVDAGLYQLRVDAVNVAGDVTSRIETPFKREAPAVLADATEGQEGPVRAITVQTGDTLWAIARDRYGEGVLFVRVFEANRGDIRNPDLIYPGQVFDLPIE